MTPGQQNRATDARRRPGPDQAVEITAELAEMLAAVGERSVEDWALDSDYRWDPEAGWTHPDGHPVDIVGCLAGAVESLTLDDDEEVCATEGCDGRLDDGEGWDGRCGSCADLIFAAEEPDDEPARTDGPLRGSYVTVDGYRGVHFYVDADDGAGRVIAHMVGDDRPFALSADELTVVDRDSVCSCGQVGCGWGH